MFSHNLISRTGAQLHGHSQVISDAVLQVQMRACTSVYTAKKPRFSPSLVNAGAFNHSMSSQMALKAPHVCKENRTVILTELQLYNSTGITIAIMTMYVLLQVTAWSMCIGPCIFFALKSVYTWVPLELQQASTLLWNLCPMMPKTHCLPRL